MEVVDRTVEFVGAAFGHQGDLRAGSAALVCTRIGGRGPEFADRIQAKPNDGSEGPALVMIVHIDAVQSDIGLVAPATVHRAIAVVGVVVVERCHTRLKGQ